MANYNAVKAAVLGRAFDIDKAYGNQCWDGVFYVAETYLGGKRCHCGISGYVKDIAAQKSTNGILNWCKDIGLYTDLQPGDICIWGNCAACPDSHIAFYDHDNGSNEVYFLGQNQGGPNGAFNVKRIPINGIIAVFRPNAWSNSAASTTSAGGIPDGFTRETAAFTVTVDTLNVRDQPSTKGNKVAQYKKGQSLIYDCFKAEKNGYVWLSYIGASGNRRYIAGGETNAAGYRSVSYGTFK